uniref:28S ribosomal protein S28, mitochondrial n=1 Tax=Ciona savignyi TaxID=51511 RepID=H2YG89_CIOSA
MYRFTRGIPLSATLASKHGHVCTGMRKMSETTKVQTELGTSNNESSKVVSFATLLRNSPFVHLSAQKLPKVVGRIMKIHDNNLYIDIGTKFYCVCPVSSEDLKKYHEDGKVMVAVKDFELSASFLAQQQIPLYLKQMPHCWAHSLNNHKHHIFLYVVFMDVLSHGASVVFSPNSTRSTL